jgi:hypothetical protein
MQIIGTADPPFIMQMRRAGFDCTGRWRGNSHWTCSAALCRIFDQTDKRQRQADALPLFLATATSDNKKLIHRRQIVTLLTTGDQATPIPVDQNELGSLRTKENVTLNLNHVL